MHAPLVGLLAVEFVKRVLFAVVGVPDALCKSSGVSLDGGLAQSPVLNNKKGSSDLVVVIKMRKKVQNREGVKQPRMLQGIA